MGELTNMPNISKVIEGKLTDAGITTPQQLCAAGSKAAFVRIRLKDHTACQSMLFALEGAVQGVRWHNLSAETKADLKAFFASL